MVRSPHHQGQVSARETKAMKYLCAALLAAAAFAGPANAADIFVDNIGSSKKQPIYVIVVRGTIVPGDFEKFKKVAAKLPASRTIVAFNSDGGVVSDGLNIGLYIRDRRLVTYAGAECSSVCGLAWLAGSTRYVSKDSHVGFHAAYRLAENGDATVSSSANALAGAYLARIGMSYDAIAELTKAAPDDMLWLDDALAAKLKIKVTVFK